MANRPKSEVPTKERPPPDEPLTKKELDKQLDHALKETFPGSDPIAVGQPTGDEVPHEQSERAAAEHTTRKGTSKKPADVPVRDPNGRGSSVQAPGAKEGSMEKAPGKRHGSG